MIDTVILDIGQVLVEFRWEAYISELGFSEEIQKKVAQATVLSPWWRQVDLGMEQEEYEQGMIKDHPELAKEITLFFEKIRGIHKEYTYSKSWVMALKQQGLKVYLLSNYGKSLFLEGSKRYQFYPCVDGGVISYQIHEIKPEPMIYQTLFNKYDITPEHAVFIDDNPDNIKEGQVLGLHTIQFQTIGQAVNELKELGISLDANDFLS